MPFSSWIDIKNKANNVGEISIYGPITDEKWFDEEVTPSDFRDKMAELKDAKEIDLYINSPGGGVFAGQTIYNMIKRHPAKVRSHVDGIAASIASVIALAGDEIIMPKNAMMMIHRASGVAFGTADDMLATAAAMERVEQTIIAVYAERTGLKEEKIKGLMAAETWMTADEALELGFADRVEKEMKIAACMKGNIAIINGQEIKIDSFRAFPKDKLPAYIENKQRPDYGAIEAQLKINQLYI